MVDSETGRRTSANVKKIWESWAIKKAEHHRIVLEKTLEGPVD